LFTLESMVKTVFGLKRRNKSKQRVRTEVFALRDSLCRLIPNWLRCADKADSHSYHACHIFKFSFSPFERIFLLKKLKKKFNLILPPFCRCVCPVFPHSYFGNALPGFTKYGVNMSLQPLAKFVGRGGVQGRQMALKYFFYLRIVFSPLLN